MANASNENKLNALVDAIGEVNGYAIRESVAGSREMKEYNRTKWSLRASALVLVLVIGISTMLIPRKGDGVTVGPEPGANGADVYWTDTTETSDSDSRSGAETEGIKSIEEMFADKNGDGIMDVEIQMQFDGGEFEDCYAYFNIYDDHAELISISDGARAVIVPSKIGDVPVTAIADNAIPSDHIVRIFAAGKAEKLAKSYAVEHGHIFIECSNPSDYSTNTGMPDHYYPARARMLNWYERDTSNDDFIAHDDNECISELIEQYLSDKEAGTNTAGNGIYDLVYGEGYDELAARLAYRLLCMTEVTHSWGDGYMPKYVYDDVISEGFLDTDYDRHRVYFFHDMVGHNSYDENMLFCSLWCGGAETAVGDMKTADDFRRYFAEFDPDLNVLDGSEDDYSMWFMLPSLNFHEREGMMFSYRLFLDGKPDHYIIRNKEPLPHDEYVQWYLNMFGDEPTENAIFEMMFAFPVFNITENSFEINSFYYRDGTELSDKELLMRPEPIRFEKTDGKWVPVREYKYDNGSTSVNDPPRYDSQQRQACILMMEAQGIR